MRLFSKLISTTIILSFAIFARAADKPTSNPLVGTWQLTGYFCSSGGPRLNLNVDSVQGQDQSTDGVTETGLIEPDLRTTYGLDNRVTMALRSPLKVSDPKLLAYQMQLNNLAKNHLASAEQEEQLASLNELIKGLTCEGQASGNYSLDRSLLTTQLDTDGKNLPLNCKTQSGASILVKGMSAVVTLPKIEEKQFKIDGDALEFDESPQPTDADKAAIKSFCGNENDHLLQKFARVKTLQ